MQNNGQLVSEKAFGTWRNTVVYIATASALFDPLPGTRLTRLRPGSRYDGHHRGSI